MRWNSKAVSIWMSLMARDVEQLLQYLWIIHTSSFEKLMQLFCCLNFGVHCRCQRFFPTFILSFVFTCKAICRCSSIIWKRPEGRTLVLAGTEMTPQPRIFTHPGGLQGWLEWSKKGKGKLYRGYFWYPWASLANAGLHLRFKVCFVDKSASSMAGAELNSNLVFAKKTLG